MPIFSEFRRPFVGFGFLWFRWTGFGSRSVPSRFQYDLLSFHYLPSICLCFLSVFLCSVYGFCFGPVLTLIKIMLSALPVHGVAKTAEHDGKRKRPTGFVGAAYRGTTKTTTHGNHTKAA